MARPLLHAIGAERGRLRVRSAGPAALLELLAADALFDEADAWPTHRTSRHELIRSVRAWQPSAALVLAPSFSSAFQAWRTGAPVRVGFAGDGRSALLTHRVRRPARGEAHLSEEYAALGELLEIPRRETPLLRVPGTAETAASELLRESGLAGGRLALLAPGAIYGPAKRWEAVRFAELGARLIARGFMLAVCGTLAEREACDEVARGIAPAGERAPRVASLAGRTSLPALAGLCARSAVAVCNDSGLAHLAAAVGTPTVALFGSTSSSWSAPLGPRVRVIQHAPVCAPCFQRRCSIGYGCLHAIGVDEVEAACVAMAA